MAAASLRRRGVSLAASSAVLGLCASCARKMQVISHAYTAQYGRCGVVIGGIDVPEEKGRIMLSDLRDTRTLILALAQNADAILHTLDSLPATHRVQSAGQMN